MKHVVDFRLKIHMFCLLDAAALYYDWSSGVRIRANIGHIEDWANRNQLDEEFGQQFEKLLKATEFLSTSKSLLMRVLVAF